MAPDDRHDDRRDHLWHTAAPRPSGETTTGKRVLAVVFLVVVVVVVVGALVLVAGGFVSTDSPTPGLII